MTLEVIKDKITKHLRETTKQIRFVNFEQANELADFLQFFDVGNTRVISASNYCAADENLRMEEVLNDLRSTRDNTILIGLTSLLRLYGEQELIKQLESMCEMSVGSQIVIVCFRCSSVFESIGSDPRHKRLLYSTNAANSVNIDLVFVHPYENLSSLPGAINGIENIPDAIEQQGKNKIIVYTKKGRDTYPNSVYRITEIQSAYDLLLQAQPDIAVLDRCLGSEEQWQHLFNQCGKDNNVNGVLQKELGVPNNFEILITQWNQFDATKKWLLLIALKLYGVKSNWTLERAVSQSNSVSDLIKNIYRNILDIKPTDKTFWNKYTERKTLLRNMGDQASAADFCAYVGHTERDAIYYLTDLTPNEKEKIFAYIDKYAEGIDDAHLLEIIKHIYPDLYLYLQPYRFNIGNLNSYFQQYKMQKVRNRLYPEFEEIVDKEAVERSYNLLLPMRTEKLDALKKSKQTALYFLDAMGVEYLAYVMAKCAEKGLRAKVTVCRCNLPSLTSFNKEFLEIFRAAGATVYDNIKELDDIKHHGKDDFDYQKTKLPIHLMRELEIVEEVIDKAKIQLQSGKYKNAFIISDHGASRLAVIKEKVLEMDVDAKGTHGGRVCAYTDAVSKIPYTTQESGYCILASYDRFKGGRAASVETHGGATLEEVVVPIIEITNQSSAMEFVVKTPIIAVSFRKKAELRVYSKTAIDNMAIMLNGKFYDGVLEDSQSFMFDIGEYKQAGTYTFDVYVDNNKEQSGLTFIIKKEGMSYNSLL